MFLTKMTHSQTFPQYHFAALIRLIYTKKINNISIYNFYISRCLDLPDLPDATETVAHGGQTGLKVFIRQGLKLYKDMYIKNVKYKTASVNLTTYKGQNKMQKHFEADTELRFYCFIF